MLSYQAIESMILRDYKIASDVIEMMYLHRCHCMHGIEGLPSLSMVSLNEHMHAVLERWNDVLS